MVDARPPGASDVPIARALGCLSSVLERTLQQNLAGRRQPLARRRSIPAGVEMLPAGVGVMTNQSRQPCVWLPSRPTHSHGQRVVGSIRRRQADAPQVDEISQGSPLIDTWTPTARADLGHRQRRHGRPRCGAAGICTSRLAPIASTARTGHPGDQPGTAPTPVRRRQQRRQLRRQPSHQSGRIRSIAATSRHDRAGTAGRAAEFGDGPGIQGNHGRCASNSRRSAEPPNT